MNRLVEGAHDQQTHSPRQQDWQPAGLIGRSVVMIKKQHEVDLSSGVHFRP